jgi:hypothetical protein
MDPLSITASVVGITTAALQSVQFLVKTIDNVKDAPATIKEISADLRAIETVLQDLNVKRQDDSSQLIQSKQVGPAVENCDRACKAFQLQVEQWMKHSKEDKIFWISRWKIGLFGQEKIKTFKAQLNDCKSTLNVALTTATLFVSHRTTLILYVMANELDRLVVTGQKDLTKEQKDSILKANEADIEQELTRAGKEMVEIEQTLQQLTIRGNTASDEESEQSRLELLEELERQRAASTALREMCEDALSRTVHQRTGQKIKCIRATNDSVALVGFINASANELNMDQELSDVSADNKSFVVVGVAKNVDLKDLRSR